MRDRLRLTVQLSSASDGFQRWSHEYERGSADVFAMQDELTRAIVAELEPTLRGTATQVASERRGTGDAAAYEHYLRGRYFWQRRGQGAVKGLARSLERHELLGMEASRGAHRCSIRCGSSGAIGS